MLELVLEKSNLRRRHSLGMSTAYSNHGHATLPSLFHLDLRELIFLFLSKRKRRIREDVPGRKSQWLIQMLLYCMDVLGKNFYISPFSRCL
jgi:hypothetical protein